MASRARLFNRARDPGDKSQVIASTQRRTAIRFGGTTYHQQEDFAAAVEHEDLLTPSVVERNKLRHELKAKLTKAYEFRKKIISEFDKAVNMCVYIRIEGIVLKTSGTAYKRKKGIAVDEEDEEDDDDHHHRKRRVPIRQPPSDMLIPQLDEKPGRRFSKGITKMFTRQRSSTVQLATKSYLGNSRDDSEEEVFHDISEDAVRLSRDGIFNKIYPSQKKKRRGSKSKPWNQSLFASVTEHSSVTSQDSRESVTKQPKIGIQKYHSLDSFKDCLEYDDFYESLKSSLTTMGSALRSGPSTPKRVTYSLEEKVSDLSQQSDVTLYSFPSDSDTDMNAHSSSQVNSWPDSKVIIDELQISKSDCECGRYTSHPDCECGGYTSHPDNECDIIPGQDELTQIVLSTQEQVLVLKRINHILKERKAKSKRKTDVPVHIEDSRSYDLDTSRSFIIQVIIAIIGGILIGKFLL